MSFHKCKRKAPPLLLTVLAASAASGQPRVTEFSPARHVKTAATTPEITVRFDTPIDPQSVESRSFSVFGRWTGVCPGTIGIPSDNQEIRFTPAKSFSAGEWIIVTLSRAIKSAAGEEMSGGFAWTFWTAAEPGTLDLQQTSIINVREAGEPPIRTYGAYAGDLNGDGFHDFTVPNEDANDLRVFLNDGRGAYSTFTRYALPANSLPSTNEGADFNGDGFMDFAVGNIEGNSASIFFGDGRGAFSPPTSYPVGQGTRGLCVLDLNGDGAPDIVTANRKSSDVSILLNNGDGAFSPSTQIEANVNRETSCVAADANEDGLPDIFVGGFGSQEIAVLLSDGNGNLIPFSKQDARGVAWMLAVGDLDNDGHVDVVSANAEQNQFALLRGDGQGNLGRAETYDTGAFPLAIDTGDLDGDGDLDVVTSNFFSADWTIFENDGTGRFLNPRTLDASSAGSCAVFHDRDRDGDLDMTGIDEVDDQLFLFENPGVTSVDETDPSLPKGFVLDPGFPNPFVKSSSNRTSEITIPFFMNRRAIARIDVLNLRGQLVASLANTEFAPGRHLVKLSPQSLPGGIYFYRLTSGGSYSTRRVIIFP